MQNESLIHRLYRMFVKADFRGREPVTIVTISFGRYTPAQYLGQGSFGRAADIGVTIFWELIALFTEYTAVFRVIPAANAHSASYGFQDITKGDYIGFVVLAVLVALFAIFLIAELRWMIRNFKTTI